MKTVNLSSLIRKNVLSLKPYSSARDEFTGSEGIFLDANENPYGIYNRYPDPRQEGVKSALAALKKISVEQIFIGNGSDEIIDLLFRLFAKPGNDRVIICPPTYGMYEVAAQINDIQVEKIPLLDNFQIDLDAILDIIREETSIKLIFLCSPNNPTGNCLNDIEIVLGNFDGIVVVDEAYIDFCPTKSYLSYLSKYQNLVVMQTFSKALALAGARVGVAYANAEIIAFLNRIKPPYNVSTLNGQAALEALAKKDETHKHIQTILYERALLGKQLQKLSIVKKIYPSDANFLLVEVVNADKVYTHLIEKKIIIRNRSSQIKNCVRITVGTPHENRVLMAAMSRLDAEMK